MINILELLKNAPQGMKLYSPIYGDVEFKYIEDGRIIVKDKYGFDRIFSKYGEYVINYDSECLLFPSKNCRTWEGWKVPPEPKFKVGDWITDGNITIQIEDVRNNSYMYSDGVLFSTGTADKVYHLWSIADVKYSDVLANTAGCILIAKDNESCLCYIDKNGEFHADNNKWFFVNFSDNALMPATKEQRELLFHKMKDAGYELDEKKKELRKTIEPKFKVGDKVIYKGKVRTITRIVENYYEFDGWSASCRIEKQDELLSPAPKPHYDITNFSAGMEVLVRDDDDEEWNYLHFSHYRKKLSDHFFAGGNPWFQCIPFNDNTEYLLGTKDMCPEEYINW